MGQTNVQMQVAWTLAIPGTCDITTNTIVLLACLYFFVYELLQMRMRTKVSIKSVVLFLNLILSLKWVVQTTHLVFRFILCNGAF